jgi:hypothetical protein
MEEAEYDEGDDGMSGAADLWRPLRTPIFRRLLIADVVSDIVLLTGH